MLELFAHLEETGLSIWARESGLAFFGALTAHSLAMACVVGINLVISLRLTGAVASIPLLPLRRFFTLHWVAVALVVISGIALLLAYPAKALTNPVFYLKLTALIVALIISRRFQNYLAQSPPTAVLPRSIKVCAYLTLVLWIVTITAGRFLAYTYNYLLAARYF